MVKMLSPWLTLVASFLETPQVHVMMKHVHGMPAPAIQDAKQYKKNNSYFVKSNILYLCLNSLTELHNFTLLHSSFHIFGAFIHKLVAFIVVLLNLILKLTLFFLVIFLQEKYIHWNCFA